MAGITIERASEPRSRGKIVFPVSNEVLSSNTKAKLAEVSGITNTVFIAGGGTQVIAALSALAAKNDVRRAICVDSNPAQLRNLEKIAKIYNESQSSREYGEMLRSHSSEHRCDRKGLRWAERTIAEGKPYLSRPVTIVLVESDMKNFLCEITEQGGYFIHLSNAPNYAGNYFRMTPFGGMVSSKDMLEAILQNSAIEEGSIIYIRNFDREPLILEKMDGKLSGMNPGDISVKLAFDMLRFFARKTIKDTEYFGIS